MSINSLTNAAAARRPDVRSARPPGGPAEIAAAAATAPSNAPPTQEQADPVGTALNVLFGYIPTEVVTVYVAIVAALAPPGETATLAAGEADAGAAGAGTAAAACLTTASAQSIAFWIFLVATPLVVWVVYASKLKAANLALPAAPRTWPLWEMGAALVAFLAWAFALPGSPFSECGWYSPGLASIAVLSASMLLGLLAPLFQRPLGT